jgi:hypothetical protein
VANWLARATSFEEEPGASKANEEFMEKNGFVSHVHRKKPNGRAMPEALSRANNAKSKVRSRVEHVFAEQKARMAKRAVLVGAG